MDNFKQRFLMSIYHLQRYTALLALLDAGDNGVKIDRIYQPFREKAKKEFGPLFEQLFSNKLGDRFSSALIDLQRDEALIIDEDSNTIWPTANSQQILEDLDRRWAQPSRMIKGVPFDARQKYLFLKSFTMPRKEGCEYLVDHIAQIGIELFGEGNHSVDSELYPFASIDYDMCKQGFATYHEETCEYELTPAGQQELQKLEEIVQPALMAKTEDTPPPQPMPL